MEEQSAKRLRLGIFVLVATTCLILGLYFIGSKRNIFHSKIHVGAVFNNISGLIPGNNVQFNGINVGTVLKTYAIADTAIKVEFTIDKKVTEFITVNAIASISTDGLLGNKLVTITPGKKGGALIQDGNVIPSVNSIQIDKVIRKLLVTNDNLFVISDNLKRFSDKFNSTNSLWQLLSDKSVADNVRNALVHINITSNRTAMLTGDLSKIVKDVQSGKGTIGALLTDTSFAHKLNQTIVNIESVTDSFAIISGNFKNISEKIKNSNGAIGTLISDTAFVHNLNSSMENIKKGSDNFNENMEALKHSWPFKKYFRNKLNKK
jgi:phospholipid/cholesterol/gamma-HCH transport system substrate-binding protein